jgi:hypothetical protein
LTKCEHVARKLCQIFAFIGTHGLFGDRLGTTSPDAANPATQSQAQPLALAWEQIVAVCVPGAGECNQGRIPMALWASLIVLALGGWTYLSDDPVPVLRTVAELGGVVGLFTLVCASEAWT